MQCYLRCYRSNVTNRSQQWQQRTNMDRTKKPRKQKVLCPHCKTFVLHKFENCYELEANKEKRWPGWKSLHATA